MIDIKKLRDNPQTYKDSASNRGISVDVDKLLELDRQRTMLIGKIESLRSKLNIKGKPSPEQLRELQSTKKELGLLEDSFTPVDLEYTELLWQVPNLMAAETPEGGEESNRQEREWGGKPKFDFEAKDHLSLAESNDWLDFERGAKVAGSKFYYLKGELVKLEMAVTRMVFDKLEKAGFTAMMVPNMVSARVAAGSGYLPRGEERQIYKIEGEDLNLIATSEIPMTGYYADEILDVDKLPVALAGISPAYRVEGGAYGKYSKGLYRVHQFNKVEMYVFCEPNDAEEWHDKLVNIEEEICQELEIPYRVVRIAAGDLGAPAYKKYDVEYWTPVEQEYRELMSCSNVTDYQSRRLSVRYRNEQEELKFVYTLNGTAAAFSRMPIALLENHQTAEGKIKVPKALQSYYGSEFL
jgi:seryl-tRNA synthetase